MTKNIETITNRKTITNRIIDQEILANQTALVNSAIAYLDDGNLFDYDDIENFYDTSPETVMDWVDATPLRVEYASDYSDEALLEVAIARGFEPEPQEILSWYLVTDWLGDKLIGIGEPVLKNDYGTWWGRTCFGQLIICDGTIQTIVKGMDNA